MAKMGPVDFRDNFGLTSGVAMGWAEWAKSREPPSAGAPEFQAKIF